MSKTTSVIAAEEPVKLSRGPFEADLEAAGLALQATLRVVRGGRVVKGTPAPKGARTAERERVEKAGSE